MEHRRGLDELRARVLSRVSARPSEGDDGLVVSSERQRALLMSAAVALRAAGAGASEKLPPELVAVDLREGANKLAEILGERVGDDVLDALFSRFCIGK